jgi:hypothetical protein
MKSIRFDSNTTYYIDIKLYLFVIQPHNTQSTHTSTSCNHVVLHDIHGTILDQLSLPPPDLDGHPQVARLDPEPARPAVQQPGLESRRFLSGDGSRGGQEDGRDQRYGERRWTQRGQGDAQGQYLRARKMMMMSRRDRVFADVSIVFFLRSLLLLLLNLLSHHKPDHPCHRITPRSSIININHHHRTLHLSSLHPHPHP